MAIGYSRVQALRLDTGDGGLVGDACEHGALAQAGFRGLGVNVVAVPGIVGVCPVDEWISPCRLVGHTLRQDGGCARWREKAQHHQSIYRGHDLGVVQTDNRTLLRREF